MASIKGRHTRPEMKVRRCLRKLGIRFRGNVKILSCKPDFVIRKLKKAIFVHGCFWHGHKGCRRATRPETNQAFWNKKIDGNMIRDLRNVREMKRDGWSILIIWQCQIKEEITLMKRLMRFVEKE